MFLIDTNVAIKLRDGDLEIIDKLAALGDDFQISIVTQIELAGGATQGDAIDVARRRVRLLDMLETVSVLDFRQADAKAYAGILASTGFSRRKVLDRMIAAQALVQEATLVTLNAADFRDIPGLQLLEW